MKFRHKVKISAPGIVGALHRIAAALEGRVPRSFISVGVEDIPRRRIPVMVNFGSKKFDIVAGVKLSVVADGPIDKPPTWSVVATALQPDGSSADVPVTVTVADDGLSATVLVPESQIDSFTATAIAEVDDPGTAGVETISETFSGSFTHSKAATLTGSVEDLPR